MASSARHLPHRLAPAGGEMVSRLVGAVVAAGFAAALYRMASSVAQPDWWLWAGMAVLVLASVGFLGGALVPFYRRRSGRIPVVEVDAQPWHPGDRCQVRVVVPNASSFVEVEVALQAVAWERLEGARNRNTRTQKVVHHTTLLRLSGEDLEATDTGGGLDRVIDLVVPEEARTEGWLWGISVRPVKRQFSAMQENLAKAMLATQIPAGLAEAHRAQIEQELHRHLGRGPAAWEEWYPVRIEGHS